jgi:SAM-dependent methyltransferase
VEDALRDELLESAVQIQAGSILPLEAARFDCVWCANVAQYLTEAELERAVQEFRRVLKPGGTLALKDFDATVMQFLPMNSDIPARLVAARRDKAAGAGPVGTWSTPSRPSRLRKFGLTNIVRKGWLIERWAPVSPATRRWVQTARAITNGPTRNSWRRRTMAAFDPSRSYPDSADVPESGRCDCIIPSLLRVRVTRRPAAICLPWFRGHHCHGSEPDTALMAIGARQFTL